MRGGSERGVGPSRKKEGYCSLNIYLEPTVYIHYTEFGREMERGGGMGGRETPCIEVALEYLLIITI